MLISYFRTVFLHLILVFAVRLMGKRQIGQMEASEFVVTMLIANLASIPMQDSGIPLYSGVLPILTVLGMELVMSWLILKSLFIRRLLCGKPVILIDNGKILRENLQKTRISLDELICHLREKDVLDIRSVQFAILETDGNLSVFPYPEQQPASAAAAGISVDAQYLPFTLIEDGCLSRENLGKAGKDLVWLEKTLAQHGSGIRDTLLLTVDQRNRVVFLPREES